ncbi:hypothetical protein SAMN04488543_0220 [Friedmanniella luteola]|uniref:Uncharacterized protein n=1 Tax=Friedmanniella luteola TaxID=546871 RepID=A0A1H1LDF1_9ACTN|nr:hypothetical protein [Friedmanniella luteola]SDR72526.1 hypothetical protein SAMN04488543_0220 [Friedmanniella luteola]
MNAGRAVALMIAVDARRAPAPVRTTPVPVLTRDRAHRLAAALAAPAVEPQLRPARRRDRRPAVPALEPGLPG